MKNIMTTTYKLLTAILVSSIALTSCVKDDLFDTPHPAHGVVVVSADFTERSAGADIPVEYLLHHTCCGVNAESAMPVGEARPIPELFAPKSHSLLAWTGCSGMTAVDGIVTADETAPGMINPMPGYLFATIHEISVVRDDTLHVTLPMAQRNGDLRIELTVSEGNPALIESVTGTLTGVAAAFDLSSQQTSGAAKATHMDFSRIDDKLTAKARLLGFIAESPTFTLHIKYTDGRSQTLENGNFADAVREFGDKMTETFVLTNKLKTPIEAGMSATIEDWQPGNKGEDVDLH